MRYVGMISLAAVLAMGCAPREGGMAAAVDTAAAKAAQVRASSGLGDRSAEILAFVDSDSVLEPDALRQLVHGFRDRRVGAVCGHADVLNTSDSWLTRMQAVRYYVAFRVIKAAESVFDCVTCCSGCFAAYRRAAVLPHLEEQTVVVSNFRSEPRRGEREAGAEFFEQLDIPMELAPPYFEGEADLKHLGGNVYIGAHGLRTSIDALRWFERRFEMRVIPFLMQNEYLYHLDCSVFPITREEVLVCTAVTNHETVGAIARHAGVIDVSLQDAESGITNCVRVGEFVLFASNIEALSERDEDYAYERSKIDALETICAKRNLTPVFFDLSEFMKSGAMLSCLVMHLNHANF